MSDTDDHKNISINAIVAMCDVNKGIGLNGDLPWSIPSEFDYFSTVHTRTKDKSKRNAIIIGRVSFEENANKFDKLPNVIYVLISNTLRKETINLQDKIDPKYVYVLKSYSDAIDFITNELTNQVESIFVLGGVQVYKSAFEYKRFDKLYLTHIYKEFDCDTFLEPENFLDWFEKIENFNDFSVEGFKIDQLIKDPQTNIQYRILVYRRKFKKKDF